jgi:nicotinamide mononucleotide (NMN) deamidase PncC
MTIIQPYESSIVDWAVVDFSTVDTDFTSYTDVAGTYSLHPIVQIEIYDSNMALAGIIDDYEYFRYERQWYEPDIWEIDINRYKTNVSQFATGGFIRYVRDGKERIGIIEKIEKTLDQTGKGGERWKISGRGIEAIFAQRICLAVTGLGGGYDTSENAGETCLRWYVNRNAVAALDTSGNSDASRNLSGITLAAVDSGRGSTIQYAARFNPLSDVLKEICKAAELSYRLVWSGSGKNFVFTVYEGTDVSTTVAITPEFENVQSFLYQESAQETKNLLYMGGTGTGAARTVTQGYDTTIPTGWNRRETFIEASDCSNNDQITARVTETLKTLGEEISLDCGYLPSNSFTYGTDFDLGDIIKVVFTGVATMTSRLISVTEAWDMNGEKITLGIGKEYPDLISILKAERRQTAAQIRR